MSTESVAELLFVTTSLPPETEAVLMTDGGALAATLTRKLIAGYAAPAARLSLRVHVSVDVVQIQPAPEIDVMVSPPGSASVTLTRPLVARSPELRPSA
jgi:hypothetical protein